jgi:hypothetical protein
MATVETYTANVPDWATQAEFVVHEPAGKTSEDTPGETFGESHRLGTFTLEPEYKPRFLIAVLSTPNGLFPPFLDASIQLTDPHQLTFKDSTATSDMFMSPDARLLIIHNPETGDWKVNAVDGVLPYAVTVMAFHPAELRNSPPSPGPTGGSPFKCRACKITAKGLALAIVAAATLSALPSALIAAVGVFLGVGKIFAGAFIMSVIGDTADVIAEKLCKKVGLC